MQQSYSLSASVRLLAIALNAVSALFLLPFILHSLGEYPFGIWGMAASITGYLLLLDFGVALACTRYLSVHMEDKQDWPDIISNSLVLALAVTLLLVGGAAVIQILLHGGFITPEQPELINVISIVMVEVGFSIPLRMYQSILRAEVRYLDIGLFEIVRIVLRVGGIFTVLWLGGGLLAIVLISSAMNTLFFLLPLLAVYRRHGTLYFCRGRIHTAELRRLFSFSKYTALSQTAEFFRYRTDSLLAGALIGITAAAHFTLMIVIIDLLTQVLMRFTSYWDTIIINRATSGRRQAALNTVIHSLQIGLGLAVMAAAGSVIAGETFLKLWAGEEYAFLHAPLTLFTLTLIGSVIQFATTPYFNALEKQRANAMMSLTEVLLKLVLLVPLVSWYGFYGIIYASVAATAGVSLLLRIPLLISLSEISFWQLFIRIIKNKYQSN